MTITDKQSIATTVTVSNIMDGKLGEILQQDSLVQIAVTASVDLTTARVIIGTQVEVDSQEVDDANTSPLFPDHELVEFRALAGERLIIGFTNSNAGPSVVRTKVKITPLAA